MVTVASVSHFFTLFEVNFALFEEGEGIESIDEGIIIVVTGEEEFEHTGVSGFELAELGADIDIGLLFVHFDEFGELGHGLIEDTKLGLTFCLIGEVNS